MCRYAQSDGHSITVSVTLEDMRESANCGKAHTAVQYGGKIMYLFDSYQVYDTFTTFFKVKNISNMIEYAIQ